MSPERRRRPRPTTVAIALLSAVGLVLAAALVVVLSHAAVGSTARRTTAIASRGPRAHSGAPTASSPPTTEPAPATDPLGPAVDDYLAQRAGVTTAAVLDLDTGREWQLRPGTPEATASIVKVEIMGALFAQLSSSGRPLTATDQSLLTSMIEMSDNDAATTLWNQIGGAPALAAFDRQIGMTDTAPSTCLDCPGFAWPGWGLTTTTPADQIALLQHLVAHNSSIGDGYRALATQLLEGIESSERWGITGGVPSGVTVALKDGWVPLQNGSWQIDSIGWVAGLGRDYLIAVLSTGNPTEQYGIDTVTALSTEVWQTMPTAP